MTSINLFKLVKNTLIVLFSGCSYHNIDKFKIKKTDYANSVITPQKCSNDINANIDDRINDECSYASESNKPRIFYGNNNKAIILLHGFIASPFEVISLAEVLNNEGYTVFLPLIYGFGGSTEKANSVNMSDWKKTLSDSIDFLKSCYNDFTIIGFSLGGAIVSNFILNELPQNREYLNDISIKSIVLVAPYYKAKFILANFINKIFNIFTDSISIKILYFLSRTPDLIILLANSEFYNKDMPLKAVSEISKFGKQLDDIDLSNKSEIPTLLITSGDDRTVHNEKSKRFVINHFVNNKIIHYVKSKRIRHQILVREANRDIEDVFTNVVKFINEYSK